MPDPIFLPTSLPDQLSLDYASLREIGLQQIERFGHKLWTDYNAHDPGITLLEVLCYAITDLGLRTDWDIKDILKSYSGGKQLDPDFFAQHEILPNYPWTPLDFRKLIIDFPEVQVTRGSMAPDSALIAIQNCWLERAIPAEVPLYYSERTEIIDLGNGKTRERLASVDLTEKCTAQPALLNGLYETLLLFEENPELKPDDPWYDLNSTSMKSSVLVGDEEIDYYVTFPDYNDIPSSYLFSTINQSRMSRLTPLNPWQDGHAWSFQFMFPPARDLFTGYLNIDYEEDLVLVRKTANSSTEYELRWVNFESTAMAAMGAASYTVVKVTYVGDQTAYPTGTFLVDLDLGNGSQTILELRTLGVWDAKADRHLPDLLSLIQNQVPAWLSRRQTIERDVFIKLNLDNADQGDIDALFRVYRDKLIAIRTLVEGPEKQPEKGLRHYLCQYRNLCEDWVRFRPVPIEEIGLECELDIAEGYRLDDILAEAWFRIGLFLSPMVQYSTLESLLAEGVDPDRIFEGPLLLHGFIDDEQLKPERERDRYIYTSDLLRILMDIPGVLTVSKLGVSGYVDGRQLVEHAENCLELAQVCTYDTCNPDLLIRTIYRKPRLSPWRSSISFRRDGFELTADADAFSDALQHYQGLRLDNLTSRLPQTYQPASFAGEDMEVDDWQSIQEDFPIHYGIGSEGLPQDAPDLREAQAKQYKGFLLFFDQLLANYCSQLSHLREFFSFRDAGADEILRTYFIQGLQSVPDVAPLLNSFVQGGTVDWQNFLNDLGPVAESQEVYLDRRNRFLSHVMARFGESFAGYAAKMFTYNRAQTVPDNDTQKRLIADKKMLLNDLPVISSQRGKGFCIRLRDVRLQPDVWDSFNVSGLKRRVCRLLGIKDYSRRHLASGCETPNTGGLKGYTWIEQEDGKGAYWIVENPSGQLWLTGLRRTATLADLPGFRDEILQYGVSASNFEIVDTGSSIEIYLKNGTTRIASFPVGFSYADYKRKPDIANAFIASLVALFQAMQGRVLSGNPEEGFHVVEHILFRPMQPGDGLLDIKNGNIEDVLRDPYSMRITVILPAWAGRFRDPEFRRYVERVVRLETPAHVQPWVVWVNETPKELALLCDFETAYKAWLIENATQGTGPAAISAKQKDLVTALNAFLDYFIYEPPV